MLDRVCSLTIGLCLSLCCTRSVKRKVGGCLQYTVTLDRRCRPRISAINTVLAFPVGPGGGQPTAEDAAAEEA